MAPRATRTTVPGAISSRRSIVAQLDDAAEDAARRHDFVAELQLTLQVRTCCHPALLRAPEQQVEDPGHEDEPDDGEHEEGKVAPATPRDSGGQPPACPLHGSLVTPRCRRPRPRSAAIGVGQPAEPLTAVHEHLAAVRGRAASSAQRWASAVGRGRRARRARRPRRGSRRRAAPSGSYMRAPTVACWKWRTRQPLARQLDRPARAAPCRSGSRSDRCGSRRARRCGSRRRGAAARRPRPRARCTRRSPGTSEPNMRLNSAPPSVTSRPAASGLDRITLRSKPPESMPGRAGDARARRPRLRPHPRPG